MVFHVTINQKTTESIETSAASVAIPHTNEQEPHTEDIGTSLSTLPDLNSYSNEEEEEEKENQSTSLKKEEEQITATPQESNSPTSTSVTSVDTTPLLQPLIKLKENLEKKQTNSQLGWLHLMAIVYFSVGGGPFGFEEALNAATSPSVCLWALAIMAVLWALPQALYIAELSTNYERGFNEWIVSASGSTFGMAHSIIRVLFGVLTNSVYGGLFAHYFTKTFSSIFNTQSSSSSSLSITSVIQSSEPSRFTTLLAELTWQKALGLVFFEFVVFIVNLRGARIVGNASIILLIVVLTPFIIMACWAIPSLDWKLLVSLPSDSSWSWHNINASLLISVLEFNLMGWDFVGNLSARALKPKRDVPLAICGALILVVLTYFVPTFSSASILGESTALKSSNLFVDAATALWKPFGYLVSFAALFGVLGLGTAFMSTSSEALAHSVHFKFMHPVAKRRFAGGSPIICVVLQSLIAFTVCLFLDFKQIVQLQMFLFCISTLSIAICFIIYRWVHRKDNHIQEKESNGFRLNMGFVPASILAMLTIVLSIFGLYMTDWQYSLVGGCFTLFSILIGLIWTCIQKKRVPHLHSERFFGNFFSIPTKKSETIVQPNRQQQEPPTEITASHRGSINADFEETQEQQQQQQQQQSNIIEVDETETEEEEAKEEASTIIIQNQQSEHLIEQSEQNSPTTQIIEKKQQ